MYDQLDKITTKPPLHSKYILLDLQAKDLLWVVGGKNMGVWTMLWKNGSDKFLLYCCSDLLNAVPDNNVGSAEI